MHSPQLLSTSAMTSQSHSTLWRHNGNTRNVTASAREWDRNHFEIYGSTLEPISISLCARVNTWIFDSVYMKGNCFSKMWRISLPRMLQNNDLQCCSSLRRQDISSNDIDYIEYVRPPLTWGRILSTCEKSMWRGDIKCKYVFLFPLINLAR